MLLLASNHDCQSCASSTNVHPKSSTNVFVSSQHTPPTAPQFLWPHAKLKRFAFMCVWVGERNRDSKKEWLKEWSKEEEWCIWWTWEGGSLLMMISRPYSFLCPTHLVSFLSCFSQPTSHITWCQVYRKWITSCHKSARPFNLNTCMLACDPHKTALNLTETLWFIYSV